MHRKDAPKAVQAKLAQFSQAVEQLEEKLTSTRDAIARSRERLTGSFASDQEYADARALLDRALKDEPVIQSKFAAARRMLETAEAFIDDLPNDVTLEQVAVDTDNFTLSIVQERLAQIEDELATLRAVPTLASGFEGIVESYVTKLARPVVSGVSSGQELKVQWPDDIEVMFALLFPERMTAIILAEAKRIASTPMPFPARQQRIVQLERERDKRKRQTFALGADTYAMPGEILLGVKVVRSSVAKSPKMKLAPRVTAT
jgi:hypothetical protein